MRKPNKDSLVNKSLDYLKEKSKDLLDLGLVIFFDPDELIRRGGFIRRSNSLFSFKDELRSLKRSSYFATTQNNKIYLTAKGRIEIIKNILKDKKEKDWNGKWWAIIFDIPEANRKERAFLRRELKLIGLKELQKSVWIFPFNIERELLVLLKLWKRDFRGDIRFLRIEKITEDKDIKRFFGLIIDGR